MFRETPEKPLRILTLNGGGLQAISTLVILNKLLDTIAHNHGISNGKLRPCDIFDTIAGIGTGGWLALLLGRFHLDIPSCLAEWYNINNCIVPRSRAKEFRLRILQHSFFNMKPLIKEVENLTIRYGIGDRLFYNDPKGPRCRHVFVAALKTDASGYNLFRTYECPRENELLAGPRDPSNYRISHAFAVTGAAKYFTPPWKEHIACKGKMRFRDTKFPRPHNVTELALEEMWGLYGTDVPISVIVNIGPGLPDDSDIKQIAKRFSWDLRSPLLQKSISPKKEDLSSPDDAYGAKIQTPSSESQVLSTNSSPALGLSGLGKVLRLRSPASDAMAKEDRRGMFFRRDSHSSITSQGIEEKLLRDENKIEQDIRNKIKRIYGNNAPPYYRLAPEKSPRDTVQNDAFAPNIAFDATNEFLSRVEANMEEVGQLLTSKPVTAVA